MAQYPQLNPNNPSARLLVEEVRYVTENRKSGGKKMNNKKIIWIWDNYS